MADRVKEPTGDTKETARIARAATVVGSATVLSRLLGLLRDVITAGFFGAGGALDCFFVAFRLPNMLRSLFAEGSLTAAFIPVFVKSIEEEGEERANELGRRAMTLLAATVGLVTILGLLFAPLVVRLIAWGFVQHPEKMALTVELTRIVFPYIFFIGLTAMAGGMLNARNVFGPPALAPVLLNVCLISAVLFFSGLFNEPVESLAWGALIGGAAQFALQAGPLSRRGFNFAPDFRWRDPAIKRVLLLMGPGAFGVAVYQVNIIISTFLASWLADGSVSYLYYAERLFQLPYGVFVVALGTASLPSLSRIFANGEEGFHETLSSALRMMGFMVIPASIGLAALSEPIIRVLLERGAFTEAMTVNTAKALRFYALALVGVGGVKVVAQAFYAQHDTRTPVRAAFYSLGVNLVASLALMGPMAHAGLAMATMLSGWFNCGYLAYRYRGSTGRWPWSGQERQLCRMAGCAFAMGALALVVSHWWKEPAGWAGEAGQVGTSIAVSIFFYFAAARFSGVADGTALISRITGKLGLTPR